MTLTGVIVRLVTDKGFGFVRATASGLEYFFHRSGLESHVPFELLREGQVVTFDEDVHSVKGAAGGPGGGRVTNDGGDGPRVVLEVGDTVLMFVELIAQFYADRVPLRVTDIRTEADGSKLVTFARIDGAAPASC